MASWLVAGLWLAAPLVALLLSRLWLDASAAELRAIGGILIVSQIVSIALAWGAFRAGSRLGRASVHFKVALTFALGLGIMLFNILLVSSQMFLSPHDSTLLLVLLVFAALVALGFGYLISRSITASLDRLARAAEEISRGDLARRAEVRSGDEVQQLAGAFNRMLERLEELKERERAAERARRDLVAAISHDLRTPLASLRAMIEAVNDGVVSQPEEVRRYLGLAQAEVEHLGRLVDDLFELTQLHAASAGWRREPGPLRDLISDTLESMHPQAALGGVSLSGEVDPAVDPVPMDVHQMQRVLTNLVSNAIRHTAAGGEVRLRAELADAGSAVVVEVRDTGEGIPAEEQSRIFEPFYRGERSRAREHGGAGLGLAIARGIVEAHGGRLTVESQPGRGSVFRLRLPRGGPG